LRKLHNKDLHNLYASLNIIRVIKSRRMRWAEHISHIRGMRNAYNILIRKPGKRDHLEYLGEDGRIIWE